MRGGPGSISHAITTPQLPGERVRGRRGEPNAPTATIVVLDLTVMPLSIPQVLGEGFDPGFREPDCCGHLAVSLALVGMVLFQRAIG